jgi:crotonobetainyl-CoA:carnitine CoA-transferase CaiB-like acyl-CoA transferase
MVYFSVEIYSKVKVTVANTPIYLPKRTYDEVSPSPLFGEHTQEVLAEILDMSTHEIERLRQEKVI